MTKFKDHKSYIQGTLQEDEIFSNVEKRIKEEATGFKYVTEENGLHTFRKINKKVVAIPEVKDKDGNVTTERIPEVPEVVYEMKVMVLPKGNKIKVYVYKNGQRVDTFTVDSTHDLVLPGTEKETED